MDQAKVYKFDHERSWPKEEKYQSLKCSSTQNSKAHRDGKQDFEAARTS